MELGHTTPKDSQRKYIQQNGITPYSIHPTDKDNIWRGDTISDRQTDRQGHRQKDLQHNLTASNEIMRYSIYQIVWDNDTQTDSHRDRQTDRQTNKQTVTETDRFTASLHTTE